MNGSNPLLDAALFYAGLGWRIIPLHGVRPIQPDEQARIALTNQATDSLPVPTANGVSRSGVPSADDVDHSGYVPESYTGHSDLQLKSVLCCTCQKGPTCPTPGKHPRVKLGRGYAGASTDPATIASWWRRFPNSNVGIATGHAPGSPSGLALCVIDVDGLKGADALRNALHEAEVTAIPRTLTASSGRRDGGVHFYYLSEACPQSSGDGLDTRGDGGLVVAPPSMHVSGTAYRWTGQGDGAYGQPCALLPPTLAHAFANRRRPGRDKLRQTPTNSDSTLPARLQRRASNPVNARIKKSLHAPATPADVRAAAETIANPDLGWDDWNRLGMAIHACDPTQGGLDAFIAVSKKSRKFQEGACEERWGNYATSPAADLGYGTLYHAAKEADPTWEPPSRTPAKLGATVLEANGGDPSDAPKSKGADAFPMATEAPPVNVYRNGHANGHSFLPPAAQNPAPSNPLIDLNNRYSVIKNIGGKCLILSWARSNADSSILIPSFQTFGDFEKAYASDYFSTPADPEPKQLGKYWTKWRGRKTYDGIDLVPNGAPVLPGNVLNLWSGFSCQPTKGSWGRLFDHVAYILAGGDAAHADYIFRYAAWAVQHPGERAEVALVFRGGKGSGKGTFANALKYLFGQHGLQIFSSRHLTGNFNGHLRNCLLLFADEAFWAGDKVGESVLKGMLTEPALIVEKKGVDAEPWRNRLHVIMAANADWVVPASHDERRYAMFDVAENRIGDIPYFKAIHQELVSGGYSAMLHDLLRVPLNGWHPRQIVRTEALQKQKARSLDVYHEWLENLLQQGELPMSHTPTAEYVCQASVLLTMARENGGRHAHNITSGMLGRFLKRWGCIPIHRSQGSAWRFPSLLKLREAWESRYGTWHWDISLQSWNERG